MATTSYVIALGGNRRTRLGSPRATLAAALVQLGPVVASPIIETPPLGPSRRRFANAVAVLEREEDPSAVLAWLKSIERAFGRRPGRRWAARPLDLDIVLWSGGVWSNSGLTVPHAGFRARAFVLDPLAALAPRWRDPLTGRTVRQLRARLARPRSRAAGAGP